MIATFGGGAAVFFLLFVACCIFSMQQKRPMLRQNVRNNYGDATRQVTHQKSDANNSTELAKLTVTSPVDDASSKETDSNNSVKFGFQKVSPRLDRPTSTSRMATSLKFSTRVGGAGSGSGKPRDDLHYERVPVDVDDVTKGDEGYKSMSSTSSASVVSTTMTMSPEGRDDQDREMAIPLPVQNEKLVFFRFKLSQTAKRYFCAKVTKIFFSQREVYCHHQGICFGLRCIAR